MKDQEKGSGSPVAGDIEQAVIDEDLEERIARLLDGVGRVEPLRLEIAVRHGVVRIAGVVESEQDRRHLIDLVRALAKVRDIDSDGLRVGGAAE